MLEAIDRLTNRVIQRVILYALATCLGLAAFGVALAALYHWLIFWMPIWAALGIVALILTIAALGIAQAAMKKVVAKQAIPPSSIPTNDLLPGLMAAASNIAGDAVRADPLGAMLGASVAGFIMETRPDLDQGLIQQVLRQFLSRS